MSKGKFQLADRIQVYVAWLFPKLNYSDLSKIYHPQWTRDAQRCLSVPHSLKPGNSYGVCLRYGHKARAWLQFIACRLCQ